jgi:hypothetical protein
VRATLLVITALLGGLMLAACGGGSGDSTGKGGDSTAGGGTVTIPSDVHGYGELEALLAQFPYQHWYTNCVLTKVKKELSPKEAETLGDESEGGATSKGEEIIAAAGPACEESSNRPVLDPNASETELALYREGFVDPMRKIAEEKGFKSPGVECVEETVESLPPGKVVGLGNGTHKVREGILLSVLAQCVKAE